MLGDTHEPDATRHSRSSSSSSSSDSSDSSLSSSPVADPCASSLLVESPQELPPLDLAPRVDPKMDFCDSFTRDTDNGDKMATRQASLVACQEEPEHEQTLQQQPQPSSCAIRGNFKTPPADGTPVVPLIKRRNVGVPKFLRFLFQILEQEDPVIITWSHAGTAFQINQPEALATQILPKYFKHNKVSSFQRQLNYFGFKKWTKTQTNVCTFSHPCFFRADKDKMKLIKRKERAHTGAAAAATSAAGRTRITDSIHGTLMSHVHELAPSSTLAPFEAYDLAGCSSNQLPLPLQPQALKRQKSTTRSGASVSFLNSGAAGRRHSTGMLPGSEAFGLAAAAAAAAAAASGAPPSSIAESFVLGRKRGGTPAEQEFQLEMDARSDSSVGPQVVSMYMRKAAETKELPPHHSLSPAYGKRQSLPHVLAPGFGSNSFFASGMSLHSGNALESSSSGGGNGGGCIPRNATMLSRRRSDHARVDFDNGDAAMARRVSSSRFDPLMASSALSKSAFQHTAVLPVSTGVAHDAHQQQQQQQQQQWQVRPQVKQQQQQQLQAGRMAGTGYGGKAQLGNDWPGPVKSEASNGWLTSANLHAGSVGSTSYPSQSQTRPMPMSFLPRGSSASSAVNMSLHGTTSMDQVHEAAVDDRKLQLRPLVSQHLHEIHFHQERVTTSYHPQDDQHEKTDAQPMTQQHSRDYIDVLLENAGLDDGLTSHSSTMLSSEVWNGQSENDARCLGSSTGSFALMPPQQHGLQQLQLSPMGEMSINANQRF